MRFVKSKRFLVIEIVILISSFALNKILNNNILKYTYYFYVDSFIDIIFLLHKFFCSLM